jgi:UDP-N-acetyl-D-mannosaminuronic acid dehydrogenase
MNAGFKRVSVIGLGYVGLPTAATLASRGLEVIGVDIKQEAVDRINEGRAHFVEPDLDIVLQAVVKAGNLRAVIQPEPADAFMIAVPTPTDAEHRPDMHAVESALRQIAPVLRPGDLVVVESTSPVGTTEWAAGVLKAARPDLTNPLEAPEASDLLLAYCPERILPGQTLRELIDNARIVGGLDKRSAERARALYGTFAKGEIVMATAREAELSKLTENAYRDVNVAFANEMSLVCEHLGINVWNVIRMANKHPRVNILSPGPGVGGHCIPIDPWFIHHAAPDRTPLIRTAREVNMGKARHVANRIAARAERFREPTIALLGLAYKPDVDDLRESPAVEIALDLAGRSSFQVLVVEPHVRALPGAMAGRPNLELTSLDDAIARADIVGVLVSHSAFKALDPALLVEKSVIDAVGLFGRPPADN